MKERYIFSKARQKFKKIMNLSTIISYLFIYYFIFYIKKLLIHSFIIINDLKYKNFEQRKYLNKEYYEIIIIIHFYIYFYVI